MSKSDRPTSTNMSIDESKMEINFSLGRNKTVYIHGMYNFEEVSTSSRLKFWEIIQEFAYQLVEELEGNYNATIMKMASFESDPGNIIFELETDATRAVRTKAIQAVQDAVNVDEPAGEIHEPSVSVPVGGPDTLQ